MANTRSHQVYKNAQGERLPGVSTIIGQLDKPAIHHWIARITKEGYDWTKYRDDKAEIGSLTHRLILADVKGEKFNTSEYSAQQIEQAETAFLHYLEWRKGHTMETLLVEQPMVNAEWQYGGTLDWYGKLDGILTLVDYKTGGIWKEAQIQVAAYAHLLPIELLIAAPPGIPIPPERIIILGIPRDSAETFREVTLTDWSSAWDAFLALRRLYEALKGLKET